MKKALSVILSLLMIISTIPALPFTANAQVVDLGLCGENVRCSFNSDSGTLTISGEGPMMSSFLYDPAPWARYSSSIEKVVIKYGVTTISDYAFNNNYQNLREVQIANSVTSIGDGAFKNCTGLTSFCVPHGVTTIEYGAFYGCSNIIGFSLPETLITIENFVFQGCSKFSTVYYAGTASDWNSITIGTDNQPLLDAIDNDLRYNVTFGYCGENVGYAMNLELGYMEITGQGAMDDYLNDYSRPWDAYRNYIKNVVIFDGVTHVGSFAFDNAAVENVTFPTSVQTVGPSAFNRTRINTVNYSGADDDWNFYIVFAENNAPVLNIKPQSAVKGSLGEYVRYGYTNFGDFIVAGYGEMYDYNTTSNISPLALNFDVNSIIITENVTSIGDYAFACMPNLSTVYINSGVQTIGEGAFGQCSNLSDVMIEGNLTSIGSSAFVDCSVLDNLTIPSTVTSIGSSAFSGCTALSTINIPAGVTTISSNMFNGCSALTTVTFDISVTDIENGAFNNCDSLVDVFYYGKRPDFNRISIAANNDDLLNARLHFKCSGHIRGEVVVETNIPNTCTTDGYYEEAVYCTLCGEELSRKAETVPALGHNYFKTVVAPTCTTEGYRMYTCEECGDTYVDRYYDEVDHNFGNGKKYCIYGCGTINPDYACEHNWVLKSRIEATCMNSGKAVYECSVCHEEFIELIPIKEHSFVEEKYDATPNAKGYTKYSCPVCSYAYVTDITDYASDVSTLNAAITEAHYYSKSKFSESEIQSIIDEAESYRELSETNAPQSEYDYAVGEILTAIQSVDELAAYEAVSIEGDDVKLENELGEEKTVSFEDAINKYESPLDVVKDGIVNAKDFAWLLKNC